MKIKRVIEVKTVYVELDSNDFYTDYRRNSANDWEIRMGESWEPQYDCAELEAAYQSYIALGATNGGGLDGNSEPVGAGSGQRRAG